jgi:hypothetical protein
MKPQLTKLWRAATATSAGALKALLMVNEHLEAELAQLYAVVTQGGPFERGSNALH